MGFKSTVKYRLYLYLNYPPACTQLLLYITVFPTHTKIFVTVNSSGFGICSSVVCPHCKQSPNPVGLINQLLCL